MVRHYSLMNWSTGVHGLHDASTGRPVNQAAPGEGTSPGSGPNNNPSLEVNDGTAKFWMKFFFLTSYYYLLDLWSSNTSVLQ